MSFLVFLVCLVLFCLRTLRNQRNASTFMVHLNKSIWGSTPLPWIVQRLATHMKHLHTCLAKISSTTVLSAKIEVFCWDIEIRSNGNFGIIRVFGVFTFMGLLMNSPIWLENSNTLRFSVDLVSRISDYPKIACYSQNRVKFHMSEQSSNSSWGSAAQFFLLIYLYDEEPSNKNNPKPTKNTRKPM